MDSRPAAVALLLLLQCCTGGLFGEVSITAVHVPRYARLGQDVQLKCLWAAPLEKVYSVKWYLNDQEFFRYQPQESPPSRAVLPLPGLSVDLQVSTGAQVLLRAVQVSSSGSYKCEVTTERPNFLTADRSAPMAVVDIPEEKPRISGTRSYYRPGDLARLTCTSARSLPPARLTWYINDQEAPAEYLVPGLGSQSPGGLQETRLGLEFLVEGQHLQERGELRLRCSASISSLYYKTRQHAFQGPPSYSAPVLEESKDITSGGEGSGGAPLVLLGMAVTFRCW